MSSETVSLPQLDNYNGLTQDNIALFKLSWFEIKIAEYTTCIQLNTLLSTAGKISSELPVNTKKLENKLELEKVKNHHKK